MMKKSIFFIGLALFLFQTGISAQSPDKILKRAAKALGGEKALKAVTSCEELGEIKQLSNGVSGSYREQSSAPNLYVRGFDLGGFETAVGHNGRSGWVRDSKDGLRTLTGQIFKDFQAEAAYRNTRWLNYKSEKSKIAYAGQANINGKQADAVLLTTAKAVQIKIFFDAVTGFPIREEIPSGDAKAIYDYADYRSINGIQEPYQTTLTYGGEKFEIKLSSVKHNKQIAKNTFDFPKLSNEPLPDIPALLKEVQANEDKIDDLLDRYTYTQTSTERELTKDGTLMEKESETRQLTFLKGYRISRLIAKNGKPLSPKEQEDEDEKVAKRVADLEKRIAKQEEKEAKAGPPEEVSRRISIAEVLRASNLINPRRERFRGRDVIVFDFEPNPAFDTKNAKSILKFFGKTAGVVWVDTSDKQVARVEAFLMDSYKIGGGLLANLRRGASFTFEQERVNNELWLPSQTDVNLSVKVFLVKGINVNAVVKYSDYKKFDTEVKDSKINEVKRP